MNKALLIRILACIITLGGFLFAYISKQNAITQLRLQIPQAAKHLQAIAEENTRLQFEIERFEDPAHLMQLVKEPQFSHLKYPLVNEIMTIQIP